MLTLWQLSVIQFNGKLHIRGTVVAGHCPKQRSRLHPLRMFLATSRTFFRQPAGRLPLQIRLNGRILEISTNKRGSFFLDVEAPAFDQLEIRDGHRKIPLPPCQDYPVFFPESSFPLAVISDIDDTILVSYTTSLYKRLRTLLFVSPHKRQPVSFTQALLRAVAARQGRIFYVSRSETNLFGVLSAIITRHDIPRGPVFLTGWQRLHQLVAGKKARDYKEHHIRNILNHSPGKRFILLGDDTQQDMAVYETIARQYPDQIYKIYIRKTYKSLSPRKQLLLTRLRTVSRPVIYFDDTDTIAGELAAIEQYNPENS